MESETQFNFVNLAVRLKKDKRRVQRQEEPLENF